jgi:hypothetical protein
VQPQEHTIPIKRTRLDVLNGVKLLRNEPQHFFFSEISYMHSKSETRSSDNFVRSRFVGNALGYIEETDNIPNSFPFFFPHVSKKRNAVA